MTVDVEVSAVNDAPEAEGIAAFDTPEDTPISIDLRTLAADVETADDDLTFALTDDASGQAVLDIDGHTVVFTPDTDTSGTMHFSFSATDTGDGGDQTIKDVSVTVDVNVAAANDAPVEERAMTADTQEDVTVEIDLRNYVNDAETADDALTFALTDDAGGQAVLSGDGYTVTFSPTADWNGTTSFGFNVTDTAVAPQSTHTVPMTVDVEVSAVNDAPEAEGIAAFDTPEDTPISIDLRTLAADKETLDDDLVFDLTGDAGGQAVLDADGHTLVFTPDTDTSGTSQFTFSATDTGDGGDQTIKDVSVTVDVNVAAANDAPVEEGDMTADTQEDMAVEIDLRDYVNDAETADDALTFALTGDAGGQAVLHDDYFVTFTPIVNSSGTSTFSFDVTDTDATPEAVQTVGMSIDVTVAPVNDPPRPEETSDIETQEDTPVTIDLHSRVIDIETPDADLTFALTDDAGGQAALQADGHTVIFTPAADYNGTTSFSFEVTDTPEGTSAAQTVEKTVGIVVTPVNDPPVADGNLNVTTDEDTPVDINLWDLVSDLETDDADLLFILTDTAGGQAAMNADTHTVTFTPADNFHGSTAFKFTVADMVGDQLNPEKVEFTVSVDVTSVNDAPTAVDDTAVTDAGTAIDSSTSTFNDGLLENDSDVDGDALTVTTSDSTSSQGAAVTVNSDGSYTYDPSGVAAFDSLADGESLTDTFSYTVSDGSGTESATVTVTVYAAATQAVALDDTAETDEDSHATGNVLANDQIASAGLTLSVTDSDPTSANGATVTVASSGEFVYDPTGVAALQALAVGETITDTFYYTIEDGSGNTDTAKVTITITGVNDAPIAVDDTRTFDADKISVGNLFDNDTDPDASDVFTAVEEIGTTAHGAMFNMTANGSFQYDPTTSAELVALSSGQVIDSFQYTINDGHGGTSTATVTITVNCVNDLPLTTDDTAATDGDSTATGNVLDNDSDPDTGDSLHVGVFDATSAKGATVTVNNDGSFVYDPSTSTILKELAPGQTTEDTFTYSAADSAGGSSFATVTVTVTGVDDAPTAGDDSGATDEDTAGGGNLFGNDTEHDPDDSFSLDTFDAASAKGAVVTVDSSGDYTYDPRSVAELQALADGETTTDTFTYTIEDEQGNTDTATVTITITSVNDESTAVDDTASTNKDVQAIGNVLDNDTDPDTNDTLTVIGHDSASGKGAVVNVNSDGSFTYDPSGVAELQALAAGTTTTDTFTYIIDDGQGDTQTATVTVTVSGDESVPVANDDEDATDENTSISGNVLDNDQVPVGRTITVNDFDDTSAHGATVTMQSDGSFTYDPAGSDTLNALGSGQSLDDTFTYTIDDGQGNQATATVTITVAGVSDAPVISENTGISVAAGETVT
ncbi:MAG: Ig-like domain-containing protein, partial [Planctomycetota bacterium]|nr:Ig-like domain-containing protein [Planctomycetota bacterium]